MIRQYRQNLKKHREATAFDGLRQGANHDLKDGNFGGFKSFP
jgi:hypothetical protein